MNETLCPLDFKTAGELVDDVRGDKSDAARRPRPAATTPAAAVAPCNYPAASRGGPNPLPPPHTHTYTLTNPMLVQDINRALINPLPTASSPPRAAAAAAAGAYMAAHTALICCASLSRTAPLRPAPPSAGRQAAW